MKANHLDMVSTYMKNLALLAPVQRAYLASTCLHTALGLFESIVVWRTKFVSTNTVVFYLTSALVALSQVMMELHVKQTAPCFISIFMTMFVANCIYLLVCLFNARDKHSSWVCITFLMLFFGICHALHTRTWFFTHRKEFFHTLLFATTLANNFVPFDSLLAMVTLKSRQCPPQWVPLFTGLLQSLFGGLHRHSLGDVMLAPADALGVAVNLFGLVVELQAYFFRRG